MNISDNSILKWTIKIAVIFVGFIILFAGYFYWEAYQLMNDWEAKKIQTAYERASSINEISVSIDSTLITRGERLSHTLHCTYCHGEKLQGRETEERVSPNLTQSRDNYSDSELAKAIRFGIKKDSSLIGGDMPFEDSYFHLNDRDINSIIAYIRSLPEINNENLPSTFGHKSETEIGFIDLILGGYAHIFDGWTPVSEVTYPTSKSALPSDGPVAYGKYLTQTHCARCHGEDLSGNEGYWQTPDVAVGAGYSPDQFKKLLREGKALGDRDIGFMTPLAKKYLSHLTDSEIKAIHAYLQKRVNN